MRTRVHARFQRFNVLIHSYHIFSSLCTLQLVSLIHVPFVFIYLCIFISFKIVKHVCTEEKQLHYFKLIMRAQLKLDIYFDAALVINLCASVTLLRN